MLVGPFTRQLFLEAGLCAGMRVLDVGSGMGDVAMLAAEIVGETGQVIGTDKAATAIADFKTFDFSKATLSKWLLAVISMLLLAASSCAIAQVLSRRFEAAHATRGLAGSLSFRNRIIPARTLRYLFRSSVRA